MHTSCPDIYIKKTQTPLTVFGAGGQNFVWRQLQVQVLLPQELREKAYITSVSTSYNLSKIHTQCSCLNMTTVYYGLAMITQHVWRMCVCVKNLVHEGDDLQDELVLPQVVPVLEDDGVHGPVLRLEDQLGRHQGALMGTHGRLLG